MFKKLLVLTCLMLSTVSFAEGMRNIDLMHALKSDEVTRSIFEYAQVNSPVGQDLGFSVRGIPATFAYVLTSDGSKSVLVVGLDSMINQEGGHGKAIKEINALASKVTTGIDEIASKYKVQTKSYEHEQNTADSLRVIDISGMEVDDAVKMIKELNTLSNSLGKN